MKPLAGVRITDFTVHAAGPFCTHLLAQLGAECIKIESRLRPDIFRKPHPVYGRTEPSTFDQVSAGKLSVRLNLKHPKGAELARALAAISDVAVENFRAGVMARLGLDWAGLSAANPRLVMVSVSSSGQVSPDSRFAGYAPLFGAWGGLGTLSGYADGPPMEVRHMMDHAAGLNGTFAVLAGLHGRARHGQGAYFDVAARDVACASIGEYLLQAASGVAPERWGNAHPGMAPHGVYATAGGDAWVAVAVREDQEFQALCALIGRADLAAEPRYASAAGRCADRARLDVALEAWTSTQNAEAAAQALQGVGVAAHVSWNPQAIVDDPHLRARGTIVDFAMPDGGTRAVIGAPMRFSNAEAGIERGTPKLGEHEDYVFGELLKLSREERSLLEQQEVIA